MVLCFDVGNATDTQEILNVDLRWSYRTLPHGTRNYLNGEGLILYTIISNYPKGQTRDQIIVTASILDRNSSKLIYMYDPVFCQVTFLSLDVEKPFQSFIQNTSISVTLPTIGEVGPGEYLFKLHVEDKISARSGEGTLNFDVLSPDTFALKELFFVIVQKCMPNTDNDNSEQMPNADENPSINHEYELTHPGFVLPLGGVPAISFMVNGYSTNADGKCNLKITLTQLTTEGKNVAGGIDFYREKEDNPNSPIPLTSTLSNLYPGQFRVKLDIEDVLAQKVISYELPYFVVSIHDLLHPLPSSREKSDIQYIDSGKSLDSIPIKE